MSRNNPPTPYALFVGIDVAALTLTAAWQGPPHPMTAPQVFDQTAAGWAALMTQLRATTIAPAHTLIVLEATGSYWIAVATALHAAGFVVSVVNALHAHLFAKSQGRRAKTDAVDA